MNKKQPTDKELKEKYLFFYPKKNDDGEIYDVKKIRYVKFVEVLKGLGFRRLDIDDHSYLVRIQQNVVEEVKTKYVCDVFIDWIYNLPERFLELIGIEAEIIVEKIFQSINTYFNKALMDRLKEKDEEIVFNEDTLNEAFFYYQNGYVKVSKGSIELLPYKSLKNKIWKNQILPRKFEVLKIDEFQTFSFNLFLNNIADNSINDAGQQNDPDRFVALQTIIGYLMHKYYSRKLKSVILTDARISDEADGRSGKTLLLKAIGWMLNASEKKSVYIELNGKNFEFKDRFRYQECALDTRLVHINDARDYFPFKNLFNDISEGIKAQRKNELPFRVKAKIAISTNRTITVQGGSSKDRAIEFEVADYYSEKFSPDIEFKQWFFSTDWTQSDWNKFDNVMISCIQAYLLKGLVKPKMINLYERKLRDETKNEFINFMRDLKVKSNHPYNKKELLNSFKKDNTDFINLKQKRFTIWLKKYGEYSRDIEKVVERRSNSIDFIIFIKYSNDEKWED